MFSNGVGESWVDLLVTQNNRNSAQGKAMLYAMSIMHDANKLNLPYRRYVFEGGMGVDVNSDGTIMDVPATPQDETVIETTVPWCFAYGERDWVNPAFNVPNPINLTNRLPARFSDYRDRADNNDAYKVNCN